MVDMRNLICPHGCIQHINDEHLSSSAGAVSNYTEENALYLTNCKTKEGKQYKRLKGISTV